MKKTLTDICKEEFEWCKANPRNNVVYIRDDTGAKFSLFYDDNGSSCGLGIQCQSEGLIPVIYPEIPEWVITSKVTEDPE